MAKSNSKKKAKEPAERQSEVAQQDSDNSLSKLADTTLSITGIEVKISHGLDPSLRVLRHRMAGSTSGILRSGPLRVVWGCRDIGRSRCALWCQSKRPRLVAPSLLAALAR